MNVYFCPGKKVKFNTNIDINFIIVLPREILFYDKNFPRFPEFIVPPLCGSDSLKLYGRQHEENFLQFAAYKDLNSPFYFSSSSLLLVAKKDMAQTLTTVS
jgi:hypothetical protein